MFDAIQVSANRADRDTLVALATSKFGRTNCSRSEIEGLFKQMQKTPKYWVFAPLMKTARGFYELNAAECVIDGSDPKGDGGEVVESISEAISSNLSPAERKVFDMVTVSYIPERNSEFVPTPYYKKVHSLIKSSMFFPAYIVGLSGMGKTLSVIQACAVLKRELVRVNFTEETSERHLIGGWRIVDGNTVWEDGPVLVAMKKGAVCLLDEVDFATAKVLCLQSILEGSSYINKQTGEIVRPAPGFTLIATANTKGQVAGRSARFVGARNQNEAFLDRFELTMEQDYPTPEVEARILSNKFVGLWQRDPTAKEVLTLVTLTKWSEAIREAYNKGSANDIISTRRLGSLLKSWRVFGNLGVAMNDILSRFSPETRKAFMSFYNQLSTEEIKLDAASSQNDVIGFDDEDEEN